MLDARIDRSAGERKQIYGVELAVVSTDISESTGARWCEQNRAVRSEILSRVGVLVEEIEEEFILLGEPRAAFTKARQRKRTTNVETILMLKQLWFRQTARIVEERVGVKLVVAV